jgi:2-C-methyl-D-erythritol 2,4-cyclodiphosphate synthase
MNYRTGFGYDVHAFSPDSALWLGGVRIEHPLGLLGHSDADVLIHAICDALLGAANLRDIGWHFPDTSPEYKNIDSKILLAGTMKLLRRENCEFVNADCTVCTEQPKINPYIPAMQQKLAEVMQVNTDRISIKATTAERLGFIGRQEGMAAYAIVLIEKKH